MHIGCSLDSHVTGLLTCSDVLQMSFVIGSDVLQLTQSTCHAAFNCWLAVTGLSPQAALQNMQGKTCPACVSWLTQAGNSKCPLLLLPPFPSSFFWLPFFLFVACFWSVSTHSACRLVPGFICRPRQQPPITRPMWSPKRHSPSS